VPRLPSHFVKRGSEQRTTRAGLVSQTVLPGGVEPLTFEPRRARIGMEPDKVTQAEEPQSKDSREFERLRETIGVMREKLEACRRHEEVQIQAAVAAQADEIGQLKATVQALREALELAHRAADEAVQNVTRRFSAEIEQMLQIAQALRDKLDAERMDRDRSIQSAIQQLEAENTELRRTLQLLRDALERETTRTK